MRLNYFRTTLGILLLSVIVIALHLLPGLDKSEIEEGIRNALHFLVFAALAAAIIELLEGTSALIAVISTLLIIAIVGGLSESLQYLYGKHPGLDDFARDMSGGALAVFSRLLSRCSRTVGRAGPARIVMKTGAMIIGGIALAPLLYWFAVISFSRLAFPTILSFDNWWDTHLYRPLNTQINMSPIVNHWPSPAGVAAEIQLSSQRRSGLGVQSTVSNWTDYEYLTFVAKMIIGPDTTVTVRINDGHRLRHFSEHFMATITVTSEPQVIRIPFQELITEPGLRTMDLSDIQEIVILAPDRRRGRVMLLDEIHLE